MTDKELSQNFHKQLKAFCLTHESSNLSKAGRQLGMSQPAISLLIKSLEKRLQTTLFERRGPKISPTRNGKYLYDLALPIVTALDDLPDHFSALHGNVNSGSIDIAAGESTTLYLLPRYIKRFKQQYDQVNLHLHNSDGRDPLTLLRNSDVDFIIGNMGDHIPDDIVYTPIFSFRLMLITAANHALTQQGTFTLEDICKYPLIIPPSNRGTSKNINQVFKDNNLKYEVALEASGWEVIKKYVSMDMGISLVNEFCLTGDEDDITEFSVDQFFPSSTYGIIARAGKIFTPAARQFIQTMDKDFFSGDND